jgi:hypothetical protein
MLNEKDDDNIKTKHDNYVKKHNKKIFVIFGVFYILWIVFYKRSLEGGKLEFIKRNLFKLSTLLIISFVFYSLCLWTIAFMKVRKRVKALLYIIMIISLVGAFHYDHGERFRFHGMYNFMVFCIFIVIFDTLSLIIYKWYTLVELNKFVKQICIFAFFISFISFFTLRHLESVWETGFLNKKIEDGENLCKVRRTIPWFDLLPVRQNIWTGSESCDRKEVFNAYFDSENENKFTIVDCPEDLPMSYAVLPETRTMNIKERKKTALRRSVNRRIDVSVFNYTEPVALPDVEAVLAKCGNHDKLVVRVAGRRVKPVKGPQPKDKLNILLIFIDAMSRPQFFRSLPKTQKKMEALHKSGKMHLNQFFRYGVVGFNTNPNSLGLFAGVRVTKGKSGLPIWEDYRNNGYVAGETNDQCEDWDSSYNHRAKVSYDHDLLAPFCLPEYHPRTGFPFGNFKGPYSILRRCLTGRYVHQYAVDYTKDFIKTYDGTNPWFFRTTFIEAHESTASVLKLIDGDLADLIGSLDDETLNRTAIFMVSDHGLHVGFRFLFSKQGFVEHKLPFLTTLIPERFLNDYPELRQNLDENEQKLISSFDIHATFKDLLNFDIKLEPHEKDNYGIKSMEISKVKVNKNAKRNNENPGRLDEWLEEKERLWKEDIDLQNNDFLSKRSQKQSKNSTVTIDAKEFKSVTIWGKSLLRKIENRKCEDVLIKKQDCVCN